MSFLTEVTSTGYGATAPASVSTARVSTARAPPPTPPTAFLQLLASSYAVVVDDTTVERRPRVSANGRAYVTYHVLGRQFSSMVKARAALAEAPPAAQPPRKRGRRELAALAG